MESTVHLHCHSHYSFLAGTLSITRLLDAAERQGMTSLALTDTNNVTGTVEFYVEARKRGIQPILGAELRVGRQRVTVLARTADGYQDLCRAVTAVAALAPPARIEEEGEDGGAIPGKERESSEEGFADLIARHLGEDTVLLTADPGVLDRLRRIGCTAPVYAELIASREGSWYAVMKLAKREGLPVVATNDVYFGEPGGQRLHGLLRAISTNTTVATVPDGERARPGQFFCSGDQFRSWFASLPEALHHQREIAASCRVEFDLLSSKFAEYGTGSWEDRVQELRRHAEEGFAWRYPHPTAHHRSRFEKEFSIIVNLGFVDYFLVAWDIVRYARHRNYPYVGRGSGANSIVAYCLRITNVDPIALDLFFERFLNPERRSPPDFDIDFSWKNRDDVFAYIFRRYGEERSAMIGTIATFNPRGALRESGKALGFSEAEIKRWTAALPSYGGVKDLNDPDGFFRREFGQDLATPQGRTWLTLAARLLDFPNHYGIHSGGVILAPCALTRFTATQIAPKGLRITQQDMFSMEDWHLEKLDILSTRGLGVYEDTMREVERRTGVEPPIRDYAVACADERTKAIMRAGETVGCFYVESPAMIQLLRKLRTDTFEMLTAASSIIRPGVAQSGMMQAFIERFHDSTKIRPPHPRMAELLASTFGVMVYQEDVIKVAHYIAGLSLGQADLLRRAMSGKMRSREAMRALEEQFFRGCRERGLTAGATREIWRQMESFAGYSFCKAHSASYAVLSFQEAWLKAHYPALFLCHVLNNQGGYYRAEVYIQEARRLGIRLLLPDVNASEALHTCPDVTSIQLGFLNIKDLTERSVEQLLRARQEGGPFRNEEDFFRRSGCGFEDACILIRCGACDGWGRERPALMMAARLHYKSGHGGGMDLPLEYRLPEFEEDAPKLRPYSAALVTQIEQETFRYSVSTHLLAHFATELEGTVDSRHLSDHVGKRIEVGGWMIAAKITRTKKGERMMFLNLDDREGRVDVVCFPRCFREYGHLLRRAGPFRIRGRVAEEYGVLSVVAESVTLIEK